MDIKDIIKETCEVLIELQDLIIDVSGGVKGVRDDGGIYNSVSKIVSKQNKMNPFELCAYAYKEFATRHYFNDGNKRFSHVFAKITLLPLGYHLEVKYRTAVPFIVSIAANKLTLKEIAKWVQENSKKIDKAEFKEYIKMNLEDLR